MLAKGVALSRDEREVEGVLEIVEPLTRELAERGRIAGQRKTVIRHIGQALLVCHRVTGIAAIADKPDVLWDRPDHGWRMNMNCASARRRSITSSR